MKYLLIMENADEFYTSEVFFPTMGSVARYLAGSEDNNETVQVLQFDEVDGALGSSADATVMIANVVQATTEGRFIANNWEGNLSFHPIIKHATDRYLERDIDLYKRIDAAQSESGNLDISLKEDAERFGLL